MKSKIYILLAIGILMFSVADVNAQVKGGSFTVTPFSGYSVFEERAYYDDTETYGLAVGYNFSERFGLEATYNNLDTEIPEDVIHQESGGGGAPPPPGQDSEETIDINAGTKVDAYNYALDMLFYIYPGNKFAPYAALGVGMTEFEYVMAEDAGGGIKQIRDHNAPMGFGFKYFITDMIAVRGDFRAVFPFDQNNMRATVGLTFRFGGK